MTDQEPASKGNSSPTAPDTSPNGGSCPPGGCMSRSWMIWVLLILAALVYYNTSRSGSLASAVAWGTDYKAALEQADESHRPILLSFHATWCDVCKAMDAEVFSRKDVAGVLSGWMAVGIDVDREKKLSAQYRVEVLPTFVMLDSTGREVLRHEGYLSADDFIKMIQTIDRSLKAPTQPGT